MLQVVYANKTVQGQCATPCTPLVKHYNYKMIKHVYQTKLYRYYRCIARGAYPNLTHKIPRCGLDNGAGYTDTKA